MWELYDALIQGIPENYIADEIINGNYFSYVRSGNGSGVSGTPYPYETRIPMFSKNLIGLPLRQVATCVKSWNFLEAAIGAAAINAYYNNPLVAKENGVIFSHATLVEDRVYDPFIMSQNEVKGKNVAVIGHFPYIDRLLEPICNLSVIGFEPEEGDYPIFAAEYLLPDSDYVYISSSSIACKVLPRFLQLAKHAKKVVLVGRGVPLAPILFDYGVTDLSGFMIKDNGCAARIAAGAENNQISAAGQKVSLKIKE